MRDLLDPVEGVMRGIFIGLLALVIVIDYLEIQSMRELCMKG